LRTAPFFRKRLTKRLVFYIIEKMSNENSLNALIKITIRYVIARGGAAT